MAIVPKSYLHLEQELRARQPTAREPDARTPRESLNVVGAELLARVRPAVNLAETAARFPHVVNRLGLLWQKPQFDAAIADLLLDDRLTRQGFPLVVLTELTALQDYHRQQSQSALAALHPATPGARRKDPTSNVRQRATKAPRLWWRFFLNRPVHGTGR